MLDRLTTIAALGFLACIVAANAALDAWGAWDVGPLLVPAGVIFAGLTFQLRDLVHDATGWQPVVVLVVIGAVLSAVLDPELAMASGLAFLLAELLDLSVYEPMRHRGWLRAVALSGLVGSVADSVLFLWLAPFPVTAPLLAGLVLGKLSMVALSLAIMAPSRKVLAPATTMTEHPDEQLRRIIASQPTAVSCRWSYPESASGRRCRAEADRMDEYADELDGDLVCTTPGGGLGPGSHCAACCYGTGRIITNRSEQAMADAADALRRSARELRADAADQDRLAVQHRKAGWT